MSQSEAEIIQVLHAWARTKRCPQYWKTTLTGILNDRIEAKLLAQVQAQPDGRFTFESFDDATLRIMYDAIERHQEYNRQQSLFLQIDNLIAERLPDFNANDERNVKRIVELCRNPGFTLQSFMENLVKCPQLWIWHSHQRKADAVSSIGNSSTENVKSFGQVYGSAAVTKVLQKLA